MSCCHDNETEEGGRFNTAHTGRRESAGKGRLSRTGVNKLHNKNPSMYIKFCRSYGEDKKDEAGASLSPKSQLSVELEGEKGIQCATVGTFRMYRIACLVLSIICLLLLMIIIILGVKFQHGATECSTNEKFVSDKQALSTCSYSQCQDYVSKNVPPYRECKQCADGWLTLGRSCFLLSTTRLSWEESQRNCSTRGGSLAVISSQEIQDFLTQKGKMKYWIGLRKNSQASDAWTWVNNTALQTSYWAADPQQGDCAVINSDSALQQNWVRASCSSYTYFICQLKL